LVPKLGYHSIYHPRTISLNFLRTLRRLILAQSALQRNTGRPRGVSLPHSLKVMAPMIFIFLEFPQDPFLQRLSVFPSSFVELKRTDAKSWDRSMYPRPLFVACQPPMCMSTSSSSVYTCLFPNSPSVYRLQSCRLSPPPTPSF